MTTPLLWSNYNRRMNLRDLDYLVTLADTLHFGRAADACAVSQPTLSTQIKKLEEELGVQVFERSPRKLMLTDVGGEIVDRARLVLRDVEQIREAARRTRDPEAGTLRVGVFPTLGPYLLPHVIPRIHERYPNLELLLSEEKTEDLISLLKQGRIDAALLALPVDDPTLSVTELFDEPFVLAMPKNHPLAAKKRLEVSDLSEHTVLLLEDGHCLREQALEVCHLAGASEKREFRGTSLETLRQMVGAEVGMTLLPALAVKPPVAMLDTVALRPFAAPSPQRRIGLVYRSSSALAPFLEKLALQFAALPEELFIVEPNDYE